ncbi:solute carrier family 22 member 11-like [Haemaphysalis longicornis]
MQVACSEWDYDPELARNTLVSHWNLVCSRRPLVAVADAVYSTGALAAMAIAGYFAESSGRKPVIITGVTVLLVGTLGITFADTYTMYITSRFLNSGCATTVFVVSQTLFFEVSTDRRRARNIALAFAFGNIAAEFWFDLLRQLRADWQHLQATILSPTLLMVSAFVAVYESPRWLVYKQKIWEAEALMLAAARKNGFSWSEAMILTGKIKDEVAKRQQFQIRDLDGTQSPDIGKHVVVMSLTYFSATFAFYATLQSLVARNEPWVRVSASAASALWFMFLTWAINRVPHRQLVRVLFGMLGGLSALMSLGTWTTEVHAVVYIVAKGCSQATLLMNIILILELFPTPVRCQVQCLTFACGRVAAVVASLLQVLSYTGREDVVLALMATLAFASLLVLRYIPGIDTYAVTSEASSRLSSRRVWAQSTHNLEAMKSTLAPTAYGRKKQKKRCRTKSPNRKRSPHEPCLSNQASTLSLSSPPRSPVARTLSLEQVAQKHQK